MTHSHSAITTSCRESIESRNHRATHSLTPESSNPHNVAPVPRGFVLGRFPYAGPSLHERPTMAGARKPSPSQSPTRSGSFLESGHNAGRMGGGEVRTVRSAHPTRRDRTPNHGPQIVASPPG